MLAFIKTSIHILAALFLGALVAVTALQDDPWFKDKFEQALKHSFQQILQVPVHCHVAQINLLEGRIFIDAINVRAEQGQWALTCPRMTFDFSLWGLLTRHQVEAYLTWYTVDAFTEIDKNALALVEPLKLIMQAPSVIPFDLKRCSFKKASLELSSPQNNTYAKLLFSSDSLFMASIVKTTLSYTDGVIEHKHEPYCQAISGTVVADIATKNLNALTLKTDLSFKMPRFPQPSQQCSLSGYYKHAKGLIEFYTAGKGVSCKATNIRYTHSELSGDVALHADLAHLRACLPDTLKSKQSLGGICSLTASFQADTATNKLVYSGQAAIEKGRYAQAIVGFGHTTFKGDLSEIAGTYEVKNLQNITGSGKWSGSLKDQLLKADFIITQPFTVSSGVSINPGEAYAQALLSQDGVLKVDYTIRCAGVKPGEVEQVYVLSGNLKAHANVVVCTGTFDGVPYAVHGSLSPLRITAASYANKHTKPALVFKRNSKTDIFEGTIEYNLIKAAVRYFLGYELQGDGQLGMSISYTHGHVHGRLNLHNGTLRVPSIYNMVTDVSCLFDADIAQRKLTVKDLKLGLHKGSLTSSRATFYFDTTSLLYGQVPLILQHCLVSWNKEFFGLMSGSLSMQYTKDGASSLKGYITFDDSHLRSNLLSSQAQKEFVGSAVKPLTAYTNESTLDLLIDTRQPIHVKTAFLDTQARIQVSVKGSVFHPEVSGTIDLSEGMLAFPYKPLYITQARVYISPDSLDDARIELTAKNKIKKYMVTLHITGSVGQPVITFESTPSLQEEQIVTLLLAGSEEGSLSLVMPTMIMHNLEELLFGPAESSSKLQRSFKSILKPLKHIRIMPTLPDQKGDIRGTVEIDINDRLRATVQNNLNLSEDTQVEIEYTVSDDMSVRGIKDEQGNVGGEVEMRWKF